MATFSRRTSRSSRVIARILAVLVITMMIIPLSPVQAEVAGKQARQTLKSTYQLLKDITALPKRESIKLAKPQAVEDSSQRAARVTRVSMCPRRLLLYVGEEYTLSPLPFDVQGEPVHGVVFAWESSDVAVAEVVSDGTVTAFKSGSCFVTASAGGRKERVLVGVREGTRPFLTDAQWDAEHGGDCNDPEKSLADSALSDPNVATAVRPPKGLPSFITEPPDPIGIGGAGNASNATGHPRFNANLALQSSIASSDNQLASYNFNFDIPIFDLPGRGVGIGLSLIYNSRMWTKDNNKIMGIMYLTNPTFFAIINPP